jgi:phosphoribosylaminoimidazolecarboxamide formyltransferase / IMP cyclohydrolase
LRYGENPHQKAAFYKWQSAEPVTVANCKQLQGKELSYNNILDADGAIEVTKEFSNEIAVSIIKHTNPCGVGRSDSNLLEAFQKALSCDSTSAFGGIVCVTREVDENLASELEKIFFEIIIAPKFSSEALNILGTKKNLRLLELSGLDKHVVNKQPIFRNVGGGMLAQTPDNKSFDQSECKVVTTREPTDEEWKGLAFAWDVAKHVKSNAIVLANAEQTLGIGAGQMSRVDSARLAATKMMLAKLESKVLCAASDAFYPFRDGIDQLADIGATAIIQPGGSIRDEEVVFAANEHNIAMVFTGVRHFKH